MTTTLRIDHTLRDLYAQRDRIAAERKTLRTRVQRAEASMRDRYNTLTEEQDQLSAEIAEYKREHGISSAIPGDTYEEEMTT